MDTIFKHICRTGIKSYTPSDGGAVLCRIVKNFFFTEICSLQNHSFFKQKPHQEISSSSTHPFMESSRFLVLQQPNNFLQHFIPNNKGREHLKPPIIWQTSRLR